MKNSKEMKMNDDVNDLMMEEEKRRKESDKRNGRNGISSCIYDACFWCVCVCLL
jgi:hypothetical protein